MLIPLPQQLTSSLSLALYLLMEQNATTTSSPSLALSLMEQNARAIPSAARRLLYWQSLIFVNVVRQNAKTSFIFSAAKTFWIPRKSLLLQSRMDWLFHSVRLVVIPRFCQSSKKNW
jgi:hypothetical protein